MKFIGAIFVIIAAFSIGMNKNRTLSNDIHIKRQLIFSLEILKSELATSRSTVPEMLERAIKSGNGEVAEFFKSIYDRLTGGAEQSFSEIWRDSLSILPQLDTEIREALLRLGQSLGRYETEVQLCEIEKCCSVFKSALSAEMEEYNRMKKSNLTLPTAAAAILVIVLI